MSAQSSEKQRPEVHVLATLDLGAENPALAGKMLKLQLTTYAPGAANTPHSHAGKPETVHTIAGEITEYHRDGRVVTYSPGDSFAAGKDTFHHMANHGTVPAQMIVAQVVAKEKA